MPLFLFPEKPEGGKAIENSREEEKVLLALPFPQTAVPTHPCLVQFSADRDLQQTNLLHSGTSLAASSGLAAQRLEQAIPIKPSSPLESFFPLKGENRLQFHWQQSCHLCHKQTASLFLCRCQLCPYALKIQLFFLVFCHHSSLPVALYLIPFYGSHVQHCLVQIMKAQTPPATGLWVVNLPYPCSGNPCAIF